MPHCPVDALYSQQVALFNAQKARQSSGFVVEPPFHMLLPSRPQVLWQPFPTCTLPAHVVWVAGPVGLCTYDGDQEGAGPLGHSTSPVKGRVTLIQPAKS